MSANNAKKSIADEMAETILESLAAGVVPWECPFKPGAGVDANTPRSLDGRPYRGMNRFILQLLCKKFGWESPIFATFKAAKAAGGMVRKGEHGIRVMFWRPVGKKDGGNGGENENGGDGGNAGGDHQCGGGANTPGGSGYVRYNAPGGAGENDDDDGRRDRRGVVVGSYTVFNVSQIDGLPPPPPPPPAVSTPIEAANKIIEDWAKRDLPEIDVDACDTPCYIPSRDLVRIMPQDGFKAPEWWYHAIFHELAHSTGHASRLARKSLVDESDAARAREELVADMCAAMLDQHVGISITRDNTAAYCASWLKAIQDLPGRVLLTAAAQAQKAYDYIIGAGVGGANG